MIMNMYAIEDRVANEFGEPFNSQSNEVAIRSFGLSVNDPSSLLNKAPEDFNLFYVGTYDTKTGTMIGVKPELIAKGLGLKKGD